MNKFKKLYRDFFGVSEGKLAIPSQPEIDATTKSMQNLKIAMQDLGKTMKDNGLMSEYELDAVGNEDDDIDNDGNPNTKTDKYLKHRRDVRKKAIGESNKKPKRWQDNDGDGKWYEDEDVNEAQLINNITDYRGGVEYVLRDPAEAESVAQEIQQWAEKKGFTVVSKKISASGKVGYFYFRLGQDPALESQKIQGYVAQKPEVKHFRFNVRGEQTPQPQRPTRRRNPNINI